MRSTATAPRPSHTGRYAEPNGTTASIHRIGAKPSITAVATWTTTNATDSNDRFRCTRCTTNRGDSDGAHRTAFTIPSTVTDVSSTSETAPVLRVRYQTALDETAAITRPPGQATPRSAGRIRRGRPVGTAAA